MDTILDFSFDDSKVINTNGIDRFKQDRPNQCDRVSIIAFRTLHEAVLKAQTIKRGANLTDEEKAEILKKVDIKLAEQLKKEVKDLTEIDRLDVKSPRFSSSFTHYKDGVGSIRCLGIYNGTELVKPGLCCKEIGEANQTIATVIVRYPVDNDKQVDPDLFSKHKYTHIETFKLSPKKYDRIAKIYVDGRKNSMYVLDLKVTLDGDPRYQKQIIENALTAFWHQEACDLAVRTWVLDQGIRNYKHVKSELGYEMNENKLQEKLHALKGGTSPNQSPEASAPTPKLESSYDSLLDS